MSESTDPNHDVAVSSAQDVDRAPLETRDEGAATLVRHLAHELRQPLSTIESIAYYLNLVLPPDAPDVRQQLGKLQELVEQSNWIVSNAVDFVQPKPPLAEHIVLADLVSRAEAPCGEMGSPVDVIDGDGAPPLRLDPAQGEHLFRNVITLFRHVACEGSAIEVRAARRGEDVRVEFSAQSQRYSRDWVDAISQPWCPCLPSGSGLGIASMHRIIEAHGGSVEASARDGCVLIAFTLPA